MVCLIVPCFNEVGRLNADAFARFLGGSSNDCVCFVNDGSRDETASFLDRFVAAFPARAFVVHLEHNVGKAEAVRRGVLQMSKTGRFTILGYWDADLAAPLSEVAPMVETMRQHPQCDLVLGSRWKRLGALIVRRWIRHVLGRVFATLASHTLDLPVYDSQCGAKLFRARVADVMFGEPFLTRWLFDVEILARLKVHVGVSRMNGAALEFPLGEWQDVGGSKMPFAQMASAPANLLTIYLRYPRR